jgi:hypothetical protein
MMLCLAASFYKFNCLMKYPPFSTTFRLSGTIIKSFLCSISKVFVLLSFPTFLLAQDYTITTTATTITVTDVAGNTDGITLTEGAGGTLRVEIPMRTYSLNGGAIQVFPVNLSLVGITSITINAGGGNDIINLTEFKAALPSLTINGGEGNDIVNINGSVSFAINRFLNLDMQNDAPAPGEDRVVFAPGAVVSLSGTGTATIKVSRNVAIPANAGIDVQNGNLIVEANQQLIPTPGNFMAISIIDGFMESKGNGAISLKAYGGIFVQGNGRITGGIGSKISIIGDAGENGELLNGIYLLQGATISTSNEDIYLEGKGLRDISQINTNGIVGANGCNILVTGTGNIIMKGEAGKGGFAAGVGFNGFLISTENGNIDVEGKGMGAFTSPNSHGIYAEKGRFLANGTGKITFNGTGGIGTGNKQMGIWLAPETLLVTENGNIDVTGTGGGDLGNGKENFGVYINGGIVTGGGAGKVTVNGTGGHTAGDDNYGVHLLNSGEIKSAGGHVEVNGEGRAKGTANKAYGVFVDQLGKITAESGGDVIINGKGGKTRGDNHYGIYLLNGASISTVNGNITMDGQGGGEGLCSENMGIRVREISIKALGSGNIFLKGKGGYGEETPSGNYGVNFEKNHLISTTQGNILIEGNGGGAANSSWDIGIWIEYGNILAGGTGKITLVGFGGKSDSHAQDGIRISVDQVIQTTNGNIEVTGTSGGIGPNAAGIGVVLWMNSKLKAGGMGNVFVTGNGNPTNASGLGVSIGSNIELQPTQIETEGGDIIITGGVGNGSSYIGISSSAPWIYSSINTQSHGGNVTLIANSMRFASNKIATQPSGKITLKPYTPGVAIDLGLDLDPTGGPLALTDAELDNFTTGTLVIGDATSGPINISANITRPAATHMQLISNGDITISSGQLHTAGGNLLLKPGPTPAALKPTKAGVDVTVGTLSFGSDLAIEIHGTSVDNGYNQLNVAGIVNLTGVDLKLSGTHNPANGNSFTIVNNDGHDAIVGTFNGLPQGAAIPNFLGSGYPATISYTGGTGNDVVILVASIPENKNLCPGTSSTLPSVVLGNNYQWQQLVGNVWSNLTNNENFVGVNSSNLQLLNLPTTFYGTQIRCVINGNQFSPTYTIKFVTSWSGAFNNNWNTAANWSCGMVPDKFVDVLLPAGLDVYPTVNITNAEARNVELKTGAKITIPSANKLTVGGQ